MEIFSEFGKRKGRERELGRREGRGPVIALEISLLDA